LVSEGVRRFLEADKSNKIKLVNMGCKVFEKGKESFSGHECLYRLCQEGIHYILPWIENRKLKVPLDFFKKVLSIHSMTHEDIESIEVREKIRTMTQGSFTLYIDE
jgi:multisite-specific tRNA:(cytosine-C5)-methyltransferase